MDCRPSGSFFHGIIQARILEWVDIPYPGDLPDPGIEPESPALQAEAWSDCHFQYHHENPTHITLYKPFQPWRRKWQPTPVLLPGKSHGQRSLVGFMGSQTWLSNFTFTFELSQRPISQYYCTWKSDVEPRTFTKCEKFIWYYCSPVRGSYTRWVRDLTFYHDCAPPTVSLWLLLCPWTWGIFFWLSSNILLLMVVEQLVVILVFSQERMSTGPSTPPSWMHRGLEL